MTSNDRFKDKQLGTPTIISEHTTLSGSMHSKQHVIIQGEFIGDCDINNLLSLEMGASWKGDIKAHNVVVNGEVNGDLHVSEKLEVGEHAIVNGNIYAAVLAIAKGAIIKGEIHMTSDQEPIHFEEKRTS